MAWLRLARTENVGPATFAALIGRHRDVHEALESAPRLAHRGGAQGLRIPSTAEAEKELGRLEALKGRLIAFIEPDFPPGLFALDPPPPVISVLGDTSLFAREMVAVVGARNASALGMKFAAMLAADLGAAGLVVVSGLARGIDSAAHRASLATGTIAVVAGGIDVVYPPENQPLYDAIKEKGALVSELPVGVAPLPRHFPRRNRLISGLSRGVVVVEAAERSGSLITANYALEQNREVFAVPGSPLDPRAKGSNRLIRDGAVLTESAEDVLSALQPIIGHAFREARPSEPAQVFDLPRQDVEGEADRVRASVGEKLGPSPVEIDELVRQCEAPAPTILSVLLELELSGRIQRHPGNRISWR
ncbi:MAG TPA: DNA-processing protein DprA [Micropepsaceae bacterium]|nr:DNA-processing protein DprA [Micropepsaceae bacterium]